MNSDRKVGELEGMESAKDYLYVTPKFLDTFLRTLSYWSYYHEVLPEILCRALQSRRDKADYLNVLDIGCGAGQLSIPVFDRLAARYSRVNVEAFDPSTENIDLFKSLYEDRGHTFILRKAECETFQGYTVTSKHDLVLSSHSLYQPFETTPRDQWGKIWDKMQSLVAKDGLQCIIFASGDSLAYLLKTEAYRLLGRGGQFYMTSEDFRQLLLEHGIVAAESIVDTYVDTSVFFHDDENSREMSLEWLGYFLRVDMLEVASEIQSQLIELVRSFSLPFFSLPEDLKSFYCQYPSPLGAPSRRTRILFHKEMVFVL